MDTTEQKCKHNIRNGISGLKAERLRLLKAMMAADSARKEGDRLKLAVGMKMAIEAIKRFDAHIKRIESGVKECDRKWIRENGPGS